MRLEQALNHLLKNAVTYSPAGKTVSIRVEINEIELRIGMRDEGIGIASQHLERIFDRFYRIERNTEVREGSGLGLAAARATVEAHGGRIWADSLGPGQGSTFSFTLPFNPRSPGATPAQLAPATHHPVPAAQHTTTRPFALQARSA